MLRRLYQIFNLFDNLNEIDDFKFRKLIILFYRN